MGYNLYIGEANPEIDLEERHTRMGVTVIDGEEFGAPINSSQDRSNFCYPSYGVWANFAYDTGLYSVFYAPRCPNSHKISYGRCGEYCELCEGGGRKSVWWVPEGKSKEEGQEGLISNRPGCFALTEEHYTSFHTAREAWKGSSEEGRLDENGIDWVLRRLDWLVFWTRWSLDNCKYPSFANS
jgi:hypothetical protein